MENFYLCFRTKQSVCRIICMDYLEGLHFHVRDWGTDLNNQTKARHRLFLIMDLVCSSQTGPVWIGNFITDHLIVFQMCAGFLKTFAFTEKLINFTNKIAHKFRKTWG